jgi:hypothetical protein
MLTLTNVNSVPVQAGTSELGSVSVSQEAGTRFRRLVDNTIRALYLGFITFWTGTFVFVVLSVYGGLPLPFPFA